MTRAGGSAATSVFTSRLVMKAVVAITGLLMVYCAVLFHDPALVGREHEPTDFHAFHVAGTLAGRGDVAAAYDVEATQAEQSKGSADEVIMPWTYPPPYTLAMSWLAQLPVGPGYALFITSTALVYLGVLRRMAGPYLPGVLLAMMPALILTIRTGQNGFLTGALTGLFILAFERRQVLAGVPLGLMIIKPHLAVGISLMSLLGRRWGAMAVAAAVVTAALCLATAVFAAGVWPAFIGSVRDSGGFLAAGLYPLERMTSVYATVRVATGQATLAMALQMVTAIVAVAVLVWAWFSQVKRHYLAAIACVSSVFISPYNYDYDLLIVGVALALVIRDLMIRSSPAERGLFVLLAWIATGAGAGLQIVAGLGVNEVTAPSVASVTLVLAVALSARILARRRDEDARYDTAVSSPYGRA